MGIRKLQIGKLLVSLLVVQAVGIIGALFTAESVATWYATLTKPPLNPPSWVFGPVWTFLYLLLGVTLYLVWTRHVGGYSRKLWLRLFVVHLILNGLWSIIFFGMKNPALALFEIVVLIITLIGLMGIALKFDKRVTGLLLPYLAWVSFATYLNFSIWHLN